MNIQVSFLRYSRYSSLNDTVTRVETNDETLAENNKEIDTETVTEKSFDAEMVVESSGSNSKDVPDEAIP